MCSRARFRIRGQGRGLGGGYVWGKGMEDECRVGGLGDVVKGGEGRVFF